MILITGSEGFIGSHLVTRLRKKYPEAILIGVDDLSRYGKRRSEGLDLLYETSVTNPELQALEPTEIFHLAAQTSAVISYSDPVRDFETNAHGGFAMALLARRAKARILVSSSNKVFRHDLNGQRTPVHDDHPVDPRTPYGISKFYAERVAEELCGDRCTVLRQSCICGDGQDGLASEDHGWVGWFMSRALTGNPLTLFGDGTQVRDLLHVNDLCDLYLLWLEGKVPSGSYIAGGGESNALSLNDVVEILGIKNVAFGPARVNDQSYFVSANSGISKFWAPATDATAWLTS